MLLEVGASYRAWAVLPVIAALRPEVLTRAGEVIGADWSGVAASTPVGSGGANGSAAGANGSGRRSGGAGGGADPSGSAAGTGGSGGEGGTAGGGVPKPRGHHAAAQGALGAAVLAVAGIVAAGILHDGSPMTRDAAPAEVVRPAEESSAAAARERIEGRRLGDRGEGGGHPRIPEQRGGRGAGRAKPIDALPPADPTSEAAGHRRGDERSSPNGSPGPQPKGGVTRAGGPEVWAAEIRLARARRRTDPEATPGGGGGQPGPGSGPPGSPGGTPGGGQPDPPGQPTDPGTGPQPPEPPPAGGGDCSWPGHGGGPGGCPPGQGGVPPGHGGTPPGQGKKPK